MEIDRFTEVDSLLKPEEVITAVEQVILEVNGLADGANALNPFIGSDIVINGENPFLPKANSIKDGYTEAGKEMISICNDAVELAREEALNELNTLLKCVEDRLVVLESMIRSKNMLCDTLRDRISVLQSCDCDDPSHHDVTSLNAALSRAIDDLAELGVEKDMYLTKAEEIRDRIVSVKNLTNPVSTKFAEFDLAIHPAEVVSNTSTTSSFGSATAMRACQKALELASLDPSKVKYGKGWDWTLKDTFHGDCMGFVLQAYDAVSLGYDHYKGTNPIIAGNNLMEMGVFEKVPFTGVDSLLPGDVVVYAGDINDDNAHAEIYLGDNQLASAPQDKGMLHSYYDYADKGWSYVLRYNPDYTYPSSESDTEPGTSV